ncbi:hypothetical protein, partial [Mesorhizobium sp.]|uniref:hypothetical protein n=1 Tax=Mesorhizobium sp. TaxID=1871066 RepID=UPI002579C67A
QITLQESHGKALITSLLLSLVDKGRVSLGTVLVLTPACDDYRPIGTAGLVRTGRAAVSFLGVSLKSLQPKPHCCGPAVVFSKAITR